MIMTFLGVGSAFTTQNYYHSNIVLTAACGKSLLIDCGADLRHSWRECRLRSPEVGDIAAVYISHCHSDHTGGLEYLAASHYLNSRTVGIQLLAEENLLRQLWDESLKAGLDCIEGRAMQITDYFDCRPLAGTGSFDWEGTRFTLVPMPHVTFEDRTKYSYGLLAREADSGQGLFFLSTDTQFRPEFLLSMEHEVPVIFHDCETGALKSPVHAHYEELRTLPSFLRKKMWLYHYSPSPPYDAAADGFRGFVKKGQQFEFGTA